VDYKQILEDVIELNDKLVIIRGVGDVVDRQLKDLTTENFWILLGKITQEEAIDCLSEHECEVDRDGEYSYNIVMKYYHGDYDDYGRLTMRGYYDIEYIDWDFIQTFEQRNREMKLNEILSNEFDNLFNI